jgi:sugar transferase (PEP-CTERM/EpsH1 system associated)
VTRRLRKPAESALRGAAAAARGAPITSGYFRSGELARAVEDVRARERIDAVLCYCSGMAPYALDGPEPKVLDLVDVDSEKWREYARRAALPGKAVYGLEHRLLRRYERRLVGEFDRSILISAEERDLLAAFADASRVAVVSNGVEADWLARRDARPREPRLVFVGALDYFANVDGIRRFARETFPLLRERLPGAALRIVGRRPGPEVRRLGEIPGVQVVGEVADMRPEVWGAAVAVVPLRIAPGIQNKVLEAMAAGTPVVATRAALRSLAGTPGEHFLAADSPEEQVDAIAGLIADPAAADAMAERARGLVRERYSWDRKARDYEDVLLQAVGERAAR